MLEGRQSDRTEQPCKQIVARCFLTIHYAKMVSTADYGSDFIVAVDDILRAAQLSRNSKAGRAIDADSRAHDWLSIVRTARQQNYSICAFLALFSVISTASRMA